MSFLGVKELNKLQIDQKVILPFESKRVKNGSYELSLGSEAYLTDSKTGEVRTLDKNNRQVDINPGQFALLLTNEKIHVPKDKIAFISIKASEKLKGLVNVSGFHVDPGFNDHLLFSVYNASPSTIVLYFEEPYFPIWFAELKTELTDKEAYNQDNIHYEKLGHIPSRYVEPLKRGELTSPKALLDKIKEVEQDLNRKIFESNEKKNHNDWLYKIILGVLITIGLKTFWDWGAYDKGYSDGKNAKSIKEEIVEGTKNSHIDSMLTSKIDSILNKKVSHDTATKKD
jgi:dCTP deaminase